MPIKEVSYRPHSARSSRGGTPRRGSTPRNEGAAPRGYGTGAWHSHVHIPTHGRTVGITEAEVDKLSKLAVKVGSRKFRDGELVPPQKPFTRVVTRTMELPYEEDVKVNVKTKTLHRGMEKRTIKAKKMVPVERWKEIEEETVEVREEEVVEWIEEWKLVRTPVTRIVKKPYKVVTKKRVPVIEYVEQMVDVCVEVPTDSVQEVDGVRVDRVAKAKVLEVEEQERYEWRPMRIGVEKINVREVGNGAVLGRTMGSAAFPGAPHLNTAGASGRPPSHQQRPRSAYRTTGSALIPLDQGVSVTKGPAGVTVADIDKGCLAFKSGMRRGDVVMRVEHRPVKTADDYRTAMREWPRKVSLKVHRGRSIRHITLNKCDR